MAGGVESLTRRQLDVCRLVVMGHSNKQIAYTLGLAMGTVKYHRTKAMRRLGIGSVPDLVRLMDAYDRTPKG
jgi:FixJ family two-component response regulator